MQTIEKASAATDDVLAHVETAQVALRGFNGRIINGAGVLADPSQRLADLRAAKEAIDAALNAMAETSWPKEQDYDE